MAWYWHDKCTSWLQVLWIRPEVVLDQLVGCHLVGRSGQFFWKQTKHCRLFGPHTDRLQDRQWVNT